MAYGYVPADGTFRLSVTNFDTVGATSLLTTVEDLALWDENFHTGRLGGPQLTSQMLERGKLNNGETISYAFGLTHGTYKGLATVGHGGSDAGYRSDIVRFPDQRFSVACLCNVSINPSQLTRQVADIYLSKQLKPESKKPEEPAVKLTAKQLAAVAGIYHNPDGDSIRRVFLQGGNLRWSPAATGAGVELRPLDATRFRPAGQAGEIRFEPAGKGGLRCVEVPDGGAKPTVFEPTEEYKPTPAQLKDYVGEYRSAEIEPVYSIVERDGRLILERLKSRPSNLQPAIRDLFMGPLGSMRFIRDAKGQVTGFILNRGRILNFRFSKSR